MVLEPVLPNLPLSRYELAYPEFNLNVTYFASYLTCPTMSLWLMMPNPPNVLEWSSHCRFLFFKVPKTSTGSMRFGPESNGEFVKWMNFKAMRHPRFLKNTFHRWIFIFTIFVNLSKVKVKINARRENNGLNFNPLSNTEISNLCDFKNNEICVILVTKCSSSKI